MYIQIITEIIIETKLDHFLQASYFSFNFWASPINCQLNVRRDNKFIKAILFIYKRWTFIMNKVTGNIRRWERFPLIRLRLFVTAKRLIKFCHQIFKNFIGLFEIRTVLKTHVTCVLQKLSTKKENHGILFWLDRTPKGPTKKEFTL